MPDTGTVRSVNDTEKLPSFKLPDTFTRRSVTEVLPPVSVALRRIR